MGNSHVSFSQHGGIFKSMSNYYDGAFLQKYLRAKSYLKSHQKALSYIMTGF